ncbi:MAG: prenyltransferase/squalene oxidase repeat-containing protein [Pirellulaceae bacterium]
MDRKALGQQHFSEPMLQLCETLKETIARQNWDDFNPDPLVLYFESMIAERLPNLIDEALDEADIADLEDDQVHCLGLLLFRDMFRRFHRRLRPQTNRIDWVDPLFAEVAQQHEIPDGALVDDGEPYDVGDKSAPWADALGSLVGLPGSKLVRAQGKALQHVQTNSPAPSQTTAPVAAAAATTPVAPEQSTIDDEAMDDEHQPRRGFFSSAPPWMVSSLIHGLVLLLLALVTLDPVEIAKNVLTVTPTEEEGVEMEEFSLEQIEPDSLQEEVMEEAIVEPPTSVQAVQAIEIETPDAPLVLGAEMPDMVDAIAPMDSLTKSLTQSMASATELTARSTDMKKELLKKYGGSEATEAAVTSALEWFQRHQFPNGGWSLHHHMACSGQCGNPGDEKAAEGFFGATALALLPFLGAGQTHLQGKYKSTVQRGLLFITSNMKVKNQGGLITGDCRDGAGNMYSHALCAIVLCEAYAMTEDPSLAKPAQAALNFIVLAQNKTGGGWRYSPGQAGDTSVVGWMVMALKSGHMGHLLVPQNSVRGASLFLDRVSMEDGVYYGYAEPGKKPSTTAVGLLCRMYLGWKKENPSLVKGVEYLAKTGVLKTDAYYNYYAAQVLRQYGGPHWDAFNAEMSKFLVESQEAQGHIKGSWYFPSGHTGTRGGRLAITSLCTMTLEVYYRHLPLYADKASEDDFPL